MDMMRTTACGWMAGAMLMLAMAGCSSTGGAAAMAAVGDAFPDPGRARPREGTYVNPDSLRQAAPGMTKRQLYGLLGTPHFGEGMWGVRQWNYLFNVHRGPDGQVFFQCQLRVDFDDRSQATAYRWKPEACERLADPSPAPVATAPAPDPQHAPLRLSADTLFGFDSARLSARGQKELDALARLVQDATAVEGIVVAGYADHIGSQAYNLDLSHRRALAVRDYLVQRGVPATLITAEGHGSAQPLVQCHESTRKRLIGCLAPNRRVEISGLAVR